MENEIWVPTQLCSGTLNKSLTPSLGLSNLCQMQLLDKHPMRCYRLLDTHLGQGRLRTRPGAHSDSSTSYILPRAS